MRSAALCLSFLLMAGLQPARGAGLLQDFESAAAERCWQFSNGAEFPGAAGSFTRAPGTGRNGTHAGRLAFDFTGGGNYVAAVLTPPEPVPAGANALRLWLKAPEGHAIVLRYTDAQGQTFQKPIDCSGGDWEETTVPFEGWKSHWGGPNDGKLQGPPKSLALLVEPGPHQTGHVLLDDLAWATVQTSPALVAYPAYRFEPGEGWSMRTSGDPGSSRLTGKKWTLDFSRGARSISLAPPDRVLLGTPRKLRLKFAGRLAGHPVRVTLRTHFMTFHRTVTNWPGEGEFAIDAPPDQGWEWAGGENDGKIHGPLRLGEIQVLAGADGGTGQIELEGLFVDSTCPPDKQCVLVAECLQSPGPRFVATVRALATARADGRVSWVLRDWERNVVGNGAREISVPPLGEPLQVEVPIARDQMAGRRFLEAEFKLELPGQRTAPATAVWLGPLDPFGDSALQPSSPFGMGLYLNRYSGDPAGLALMEKAAQMGRDAGVKWSREDFSWSRIEPRRGEFDWGYYDQLLACAKRNGISVYAIVGYWTGWTKPYTEEGINDYVRFVQALVNRYRNDIRQWEIWNEPNIFFWQGPKDMYADLLRRSYAAAKAVDPDAQILGLSTAGIDTPYIKRMLELQAPFDILTIHPYRRQLNDLAFIKDLKAVSDLVRRSDGTRRPVWLTEMGWATHTPHNTESQDFAPNTLRAQAELIARSYLCAIVSGVDPRTFWYNFRNDGEDPIYFEHQMGIVYHDFRPKPAYVSYATLARLLKNARLTGPVDAPEGVLGFRFSTTPEPGEVMVFWSPAGDRRIEIPATTPFTRINAVGETVAIAPDRGKLAIDLRKGAPVYLKAR